MKLIDLTGEKFGRLTVLYRSENQGQQTRWRCRCECGNIKDVLGSHLRGGRVISCGCSSKDRISNLNYVDGRSHTRLYSIWCGIKARCLRPSYKNWNNYGGRGIGICDEWANDFVAFRDWSYKNGYAENLTIDRIDTDKNYEPSNCRWTTQKVQSNNTRRTVILDYEGEQLSIKQLSEKKGVDYKRLHRAIHYYNLSIPDALLYASGIRKDKLKE